MPVHDLASIMAGDAPPPGERAREAVGALADAFSPRRPWPRRARPDGADGPVAGIPGHWEPYFDQPTGFDPDGPRSTVAPPGFRLNVGGGAAPIDPSNAFTPDGRPTDALLDRTAMIESSWNPNAVSPVGARGVYQIMPATAANPGYGVPSISPSAVLDPTASRAWAAQYLSAMYRRTQDPVLAMAAYNAGLGNVQAAMKRGGLSHLPPETREYVRKAFNL